MEYICVYRLNICHASRFDICIIYVYIFDIRRKNWAGEPTPIPTRTAVREAGVFGGPIEGGRPKTPL